MRWETKILVSLCFFLAIASGLFAQTPGDHAILPEQCRADVHLWHAQTRGDIIKLSFDELGRRTQEMLDCLSIDSGNGESAAEFKNDSESYKLLSAVYAS